MPAVAPLCVLTCVCGCLVLRLRGATAGAAIRVVGGRSLQRIGEGSYGAVYKALDKRDGSMVAVKALAIDTADANTLQKEIHILQTCASPHIVNYKGSYVKDNDLWVCRAASAVWRRA